MKAKKLTIACLIYFLISLTQSQENFQENVLEDIVKQIVLRHVRANYNALQESTTNRTKKHEVSIPKGNAIFDLITKVQSELNAEKHRYRRGIEKHFLGSNLFDGLRRACFSAEDIDLLIARQQFEMMVPKNLPPLLMDDKKVRWIMHYFTYGHFLISKMKDCSGSRIIKKAFYDTLGGFLHYYMLPTVKASFYAGRVKLATALNVIAHYEKCRILLNTNGNGWREPIENPIKSLGNNCIKPLYIKLSELDEDVCEGTEPNHCALLNLESGANEGDIVDDSLLVALPKIEIEDSDGFLGNIWFPYIRKRTFNIRSTKSNYALVDFYKTVSACYMEKNMPQNSFNRKLEQWIFQNIRAHIDDKMFYPGLGGVLNLYETLRRDAVAKSKTINTAENYDDNNRRKRFGYDFGRAYDLRRRKTSKFLNLESKSKQVEPSDCDRDWLDEMKLSIENKKDESLTDKNKQKGKKKNKGKDKTKNKDKSNSKWKFKNPFKKGNFSFGWPNLSGLSGWGKFKAIFVYVFLIILAIFLFLLLFKCCCLCFTLAIESSTSVAGGCCQILIRNACEFFKLFLKVFVAMFVCFLSLLRKCCSFRKGDRNAQNARLREPFPTESIINIEEGKAAEAKSKRKMKEKSEKRSNQTQITIDTSEVTSTTSSQPQQTNINKRTKRIEKPKEQNKAGSSQDTTAKTTKKQTIKSGKQNKQTKGENSTAPKHPAPILNSSGRSKPENAQVSFDESANTGKASKRGGGRAFGKKKQRDDEESSKRLQAGQGSAEWFTEWKRNSFGTSSSSQDEINGKTIFVAMFVCFLSLLRKCCSFRKGDRNAQNARLREPFPTESIINIEEGKAAEAKSKRKMKEKSEKRSNQTQITIDTSEGTSTTSSQPQQTNINKRTKRIEKPKEQNKAGSSQDTTAKTTKKQTIKSGKQNKQTKGENSTAPKHPAPILNSSGRSKPENAQVSFDESANTGKASKRGGGRAFGKKKQRDDEESSKRLQAGQGSAEWFTEWKRNSFGTSSSSQDEINGKTIFVAMFVCFLSLLRKCCSFRKGDRNAQNARLREPFPTESIINIEEGKAAEAKSKRKMKEKSEKRSNQTQITIDTSEGTSTTSSQPQQTNINKRTKRIEKPKEQNKAGSSQDTTAKTTKKQTIKSGKQNKQTKGENSTAPKHPAPILNSSGRSKPENAQVSFDESANTGKASKRGGGRAFGKKKQRDDEESSKRLQAGQGSAEWFTEWKRNSFGTSSSSQDEINGKTSWQTFYDF